MKHDQSRPESSHSREVWSVERQKVSDRMNVAGRDESRIVNLLTDDAERLDDRLPRGEEVGCFGEEWELCFEAGCFHFAPGSG